MMAMDAYEEHVQIMNKSDQRRIVSTYMNLNMVSGWELGWTYKWVYNQMWNGVLVTEAFKRAEELERG